MLQRRVESKSAYDKNAARLMRSRLIADVLAGGDPLAAGFGLAHGNKEARHHKKQARALLTPDEVLNLPEQEQVLFFSGLNLPPVLADKRPYFKARAMAGGYMPNPYHPPHDRVQLVGPDGKATFGRVITQAVPSHLGHWPQHQSGMWSYIEGFRPV